jgi:hypothetical protein
MSLFLFVRRKIFYKKRTKTKVPRAPTQNGLPLSAWIVVESDCKELGIFCLNDATPDEAGLTLLFFYETENFVFFYVPERITQDFIDKKTNTKYSTKVPGKRPHFSNLWKSVEEKNLSEVSSAVGWFYYFRNGQWYYATHMDNFQSWRNLKEFAQNNPQLVQQYFERHFVSGHERLAIFSRVLGLES